MGSISKQVKIMVSCGSGIATSSHVCLLLEEKLSQAGLNVSINSCSVNELPYRTDGYDVIVSTANVPFEMEQLVFNALPLLTGVGQEELLKEIIEKVKKIAES